MDADVKTGKSNAGRLSKMTEWMLKAKIRISLCLCDSVVKIILHRDVSVRENFRTLQLFPVFFTCFRKIIIRGFVKSGYASIFSSYTLRG